MTIAYTCEVILVIIFGLFGLIGNFLLIRLFMNNDTKLNFHKLMITLAVYDTIYILLCFIAFAIPEIFDDYKKKGFHHYIAPKAVPLMQVALTGSIYCTFSISLERYLTVCHPFFIASNKWSAKRYVVPIIAFSFLYNAPHFFELRTTYGIVKGNCTKEELNMSYPSKDNYNMTEETSKAELDDTFISNHFDTLQTSIENQIRKNCSTNREKIEKFEYTVELTALRKNKYYYTIYIIGLNFVFNGLIPYTLIVILNILLHNRLKEIVVCRPQHSSTESCTKTIASYSSHNHFLGSQNTYHTRSTRIRFNEIVLGKISIIIAVVFLTFHSVKWIPNIYELVQRTQYDMEDVPWPDWIETITTVSHFLIVLNSSVNYYIYTFTHYKIPQLNRWNPKAQNSDIELKTT